jgi:predicted PurR-regulated permease PerM
MIPERGQRSADGKRRAALTVGVAAAVLLIAYPLRYVLLPFALAGGLAFATAPAVRWLKRRLRFPHVVAVLAVFTPVCAACAALSYWISAALVRQTKELAADGPAVLSRVLHDVMGGDPGQADALARQVWQRFGESLTPSADAAVLVGAAFALLMGGVLTIVLYFYFLYDSERLAGGALWLVPPDWREPVRSLASQVRPMLRRYVVGLVVVVAFTSAASWLWLGPTMGVPNAELLAIVTGLLELIPVIGPIASAALVSGAALSKGGVPALLMFLIFYIVLRLVIDQGVGPLILGRAARLHPVVILFVFLVGGVLYGPLGVLLAVPFAAAVKIVLTVYYDEVEAKSRQT